MLIKCGRKEIELTNKDIIFYNDACYQIMTQTIRQNFYEIYPVIAKDKAEKLIKDGKLIEIKKEFAYYIGRKEYWYIWYKLNE